MPPGVSPSARGPNRPFRGPRPSPREKPRFRDFLNRSGRDAFLKTVFLSGLILAFLTGGALIAISFLSPEAPVPPAGAFYQSLREYDNAIRRGGEDPERLGRILDRLEKGAGTVESSLSVLKRRRALAGMAPRLLPSYREAARRAAAAFPYSEPLAALAAAAILREAAITGKTAEELRARIALLTAEELSPLRISLHILLGDLGGPQAAARLDTYLTAAHPGLRERLPPRAAEFLITDAAILKVLRGDTAGAAAEIQGALSGFTGGRSPSPDFLRFAAEFFYDYRDPLRAAEIFSRLDTPADIIRQADALWLSGRAETARNIWGLLAAGQQAPGNGSSPAGRAFPAGETYPAANPVPAVIQARSLYNLAVSTGDRREAAALYERLLALPAHPPQAAIPGGPESRKYGLIRYSRLLNTSRALALLETGLTSYPADPLLDLELLRRRGETWEPGRVIGETWLLLGRHPQAAELYQWAAWYFSRQRRPEETAALLKAAARQGFDAPWLRLHEALAAIEGADLDRAGEILRSIPGESASWADFANLGRLLETLRSPAAAVEYYELAAAAVRDPREAARIQVRIARCLKALGRGGESRRVLEYALDLDPENLNARLELDRLNIPW
jgi:tetratricopeptide (TPR) repeat protein